MNKEEIVLQLSKNLEEIYETLAEYLDDAYGEEQLIKDLKPLKDTRNDLFDKLEAFQRAAGCIDR